MRKLLSAPDPSTALAAMAQTGVLGTIFPGADVRYVQLMVHSEEVLGLAPHWIGRLAAMGGQEAVDRLRLSRADQRVLSTINKAISEGTSLLETAFEHGVEIATQVHLLSTAYAETVADPCVIASIEDAAAQVFPVAAKDLMPDFEGRALGDELARLKAVWIASEFGLGKTDLLGPARP